MLTRAEAARELLTRRKARAGTLTLLEYILRTNPAYVVTDFARIVCAEVDLFIERVNRGERPILVLQAPPQHGKSEIVSRALPAYLAGLFPNIHIASASYNATIAGRMAKAVRRRLGSREHAALWPAPPLGKYKSDTTMEFDLPRGDDGTYVAVGVGGGITGLPVDIGIIDDPTKSAEDALSATFKEKVWNWYTTEFSTRLSQKSGQIIMATSWGEDDLPSRILQEFKGSPRLTHLAFPAINEPDMPGYNPALSLGALVPQLHSLEKLLDTKNHISAYWWNALYQQAPIPAEGNVFKVNGLRYYLTKDLPATFEQVICSWDCTFKDTDGSDFVVGQVWAKSGANAYLLDQVRARMSFTATRDAVVKLRNKWPLARVVLIEDKANGPAVIDELKKTVFGILPVEPDGSKLARAHAITALWEAGNIWLPHKDLAPWIGAFIAEILGFPAGAHDDQVDTMTQGVRHLFPVYGRILISADALEGILRG